MPASAVAVFPFDKTPIGIYTPPKPITLIGASRSRGRTMFIWGTESDTVDLGPAGKDYCPNCEKERPFSYVLQYSWNHAYYIFGYVNKRQFSCLCDVCSRGRKMKKSEVEEDISDVPIPFMRRFGCLVFLLLVGGLIVISILLGTNANRR